MCPGSLATNQRVRPLGVSGVDAQATDLGVYLPGGFGLVPQAASPLIWVRSRPGLQVCAGAAYPVFTVQGLREWGCKRPRLLLRIL